MLTILRVRILFYSIMSGLTAAGLTVATDTRQCSSGDRSNYLSINIRGLPFDRSNDL